MITLDVEANNLLNSETIDYTASPFKLKDTFALHCIVVEEHDTGNLIAFYDGDTYELDGRGYTEHDSALGHTYILENYEEVEYTHKKLNEFSSYIKNNKPSAVVGHNIINYDLLVLKLTHNMDYTVYPDSWAGVSLEIEDTLVTSKKLNADRFGGHSLDNLSTKVGLRKIDFRPDIPKEDRFKTFAADMLYYCIRDVKVNTKVYRYLEEEKGSWDWKEAIALEKAVAEVITRQEHRGFNFDKELAQKNIEELDKLMEERSEKVTPVLPPKKATKTFMKDYTPPVRQIKKDGQPTSYVYNFVEKIGGKLKGEVGSWCIEFDGQEYQLPLDSTVSLVTEQKADINDTTHIKMWLVEAFGWKPTEYKEKDITVDSKKIKLSPEKLQAAIDRYVEQSLDSPFLFDRCEFLKTRPEKLKDYLVKACETGRSVRVLTNPSFTVGQEKEICPQLQRIAKDFPYAKDVVEYLTYKHRRNSILGGGLVWDEEEEAEKGYLAVVREDGRIPTPADTCGCATSRFKHRSVANIPRVSSLYGKNMRAMFGVTEGFIQFGYDFDSLEARIESHYCFKYDETKDYCRSLIMEKPNDVHSLMAEKITSIIKRKFERSPAKSVKYSCLPKDNTEVLTESGWKWFSELSVGDLVMTYNTKLDMYEFKPIQHTVEYQDEEIIEMSNKWFRVESTANHRWFGHKRVMIGSSNANPKRELVPTFMTTSEISSEFNLQVAAKHSSDTCAVTPEQAALVGWVLSDGYYKWSESSSIDAKNKGIICSIAQAEHKYWEQLEDCLGKNNIEYTKDENTKNSNKVFIYRLRSGCIRSFMDSVVGCRRQKHEVDWCSWILSLSAECLDAFLHAFWLADGHKRKNVKSKIITQNKGRIADAVVLAANLLGKRVFVSEKNEKALVITVNDARHITGQRVKKQTTRFADVFCLTTENSTFVIRQNNFVTITGNCTYGATAGKVAKIIGSTMQVGNQVFDAFWAAAQPLASLKEALHRYWEVVGKKRFILGIDGSKVPTRSPHAILNSLFQSAGVICAKRAMVLHDRKLKAEGFIVDFFREDWKNKVFCQQLIAYHDESQLEVSASLVKIKTFETEEEAKVWKGGTEERAGMILSDIRHNENGSYSVGYSRPAELAIQSVKEAGEYYKLNIELTAGYMLGRNWGDCH